MFFDIRISLYAYIHVFWLFFETAQKKLKQQKTKSKTRSFYFLKEEGVCVFGKNQSYENPTWINEFFCPVSTSLSRMVLPSKLPQTSWMDVGETFDTPSENKAKID